MAFQGIFLAGAFCAAMGVEPRLQPKKVNEVPYNPAPKGGMKIEARYVLNLIHLFSPG